MKLPSMVTVRALLWVIGVLALVLIAMAVSIVVMRADARAAAAAYEGAVAVCASEREGATTRVAELVTANAGFGRTVSVLRSELQLAQKQAAALKQQSDRAIAAAQAREADANLALKQFMNRYAGQARQARCALALTEVEASCPAFAGY